MLCGLLAADSHLLGSEEGGRKSSRRVSQPLPHGRASLVPCSWQGGSAPPTLPTHCPSTAASLKQQSRHVV